MKQPETPADNDKRQQPLAPATCSAWASVKENLPDWETDRDNPGDTVSRYMVIFHHGQPSDTGNPPQMFLADTARFHFPTGEWCWRESKWPVTHWQPMPNEKS
jgi:hypothetical protein